MNELEEADESTKYVERVDVDGLHPLGLFS